MENAFLTAIDRKPIGKQAAVPAGIEPVQRSGASGAQSIGIDRDSVLRLDPVTPIEDRLILGPVAAQVEVAPLGGSGCTEHTDGQEFFETPANPFAPGHRSQVRVGERILLRGPLPGFDRGPVLQPAVRVRDCLPVEDVNDCLGSGGGIRQHGVSNQSPRLIPRSRAVVMVSESSGTFRGRPTTSSRVTFSIPAPFKPTITPKQRSEMARTAAAPKRSARSRS